MSTPTIRSYKKQRVACTDAERAPVSSSITSNSIALWSLIGMPIARQYIWPALDDRSAVRSMLTNRSNSEFMHLLVIKKWINADQLISMHNSTLQPPSPVGSTRTCARCQCHQIQSILCLPRMEKVKWNQKSGRDIIRLFPLIKELRYWGSNIEHNLHPSSTPDLRELSVSMGGLDLPTDLSMFHSVTCLRLDHYITELDGKILPQSLRILHILDGNPLTSRMLSAPRSLTCLELEDYYGDLTLNNVPDSIESLLLDRYHLLDQQAFSLSGLRSLTLRQISDLSEEPGPYNPDHWYLESSTLLGCSELQQLTLIANAPQQMNAGVIPSSVQSLTIDAPILFSLNEMLSTTIKLESLTLGSNLKYVGPNQNLPISLSIPDSVTELRIQTNSLLFMPFDSIIASLTTLELSSHDPSRPFEQVLDRCPNLKVLTLHGPVQITTLLPLISLRELQVLVKDQALWSRCSIVSSALPASLRVLECPPGCLTGELLSTVSLYYLAPQNN